MKLSDSSAQNAPKVYIYKLPMEYRPTKDLPLVSETYYFLQKFFKKNLYTNNPEEADLFFVPVNLIQFQFANKNPIELLNYLNFLTAKKDHIIIALGDFSQRGRKNHYGEAYRELYKWLDRFCLLALESTSDLDPVHDIGIIPVNTLQKKPKFNNNQRPFLYSFFGELKHPHLPENHIRNLISLNLKSSEDTFIDDKINPTLKDELKKNYRTRNDYELISRNSTFTLCPAGYGRWTYRFFQSVLWGSIPVLLSDDYIKPFSEYIPYDDFAITLKENKIKKLDITIRSIDQEKISQLQANIKKYQSLFTPKNYAKLLKLELKRLAENVNK
jgi:hypothetical protein